MEGKSKGIGIGVIIVFLGVLWLLSKRKLAEAAPIRYEERETTPPLTLPEETATEAIPILEQFAAEAPEAAVKQTIASMITAASPEATEADIATAVYQTEVVQSSDLGGSYTTAMVIAEESGVTIQAPTEGGEMTVLVGSHDLANPLPTVEQVSVTPEQAEDYNYWISQGKTPFAASLIAGIT